MQLNVECVMMLQLRKINLRFGTHKVEEELKTNRYKKLTCSGQRPK
jgi:hypothetical protein